MLFDRNYEDAYTDPGSPAKRRTPQGTYVLAQLADDSGARRRRLLMQARRLPASRVIRLRMLLMLPHALTSGLRWALVCQWFAGNLMLFSVLLVGLGGVTSRQQAFHRHPRSGVWRDAADMAEQATLLREHRRVQPSFAAVEQFHGV